MAVSRLRPRKGPDTDKRAAFHICPNRIGPRPDARFEGAHPGPQTGAGEGDLKLGIDAALQRQCVLSHEPQKGSQLRLAYFSVPIT